MDSHGYREQQSGADHRSSRAWTVRSALGRRPTPFVKERGYGTSALAKAFSDALKISGILVRQHARALVQREIRIDLKKLCPGDPRVFGTPQMAVAGSQQHATRVGPRGACNALEK